MHLELTEEGWAFMPQLIEAHQGLNALVNVGIGEEEKRAFLGVTRKIHENLQAGLQEIRTPLRGRSGPKSRGCHGTLGRPAAKTF